MFDDSGVRMLNVYAVCFWSVQPVVNFWSKSFTTEKNKQNVNEK